MSKKVDDYKGKITDFEIVIKSDISGASKVDLVRMAERALNYLGNNPDPAHDYQCRFNLYLLHCPPFTPNESYIMSDEYTEAGVKDGYSRENHIDPITIGDTESRNDIAFNQMREMSGSDKGMEAQEKVHERLVSYIRPGKNNPGDNMTWVKPYASCYEFEGEYAASWTSAKLLNSEADLYRLTKKQSHADLGRQLFEGLRTAASWDTTRAYYPFGTTPFRDGKPAKGYEGHYPIILTGILNYYRATGDPEAIDFAKAMTDGFLADLQPEHHHCENGYIYGHNHCTMHVVRGVAHLGAVLNRWDYLDWAKKAYDFYYANSFDTAWVPECFWHGEHHDHSETCMNGDMLESAVWFALAGMPEMFDRVERAIRNYAVQTQFEVTKDFENLWRDINKDKGCEELEKGLELLCRFEGGFISALTPNDKIFEVAPGENHPGVIDYQGSRLVSDMMGCCPPEGMRMIYLAWLNTIVSDDKGIMVNMPFDVENSEAKVNTDMPVLGKMTVQAKVGKDFYLRPPSWAPRDKVITKINGKNVDIHWGGDKNAYVVFERVSVGDTLELTWPFVKFKQEVTEQYTIGADGWGNGGELKYGKTYAYQWVGNVTTAVTPVGKWLPLYAS